MSSPLSPYTGTFDPERYYSGAASSQPRSNSVLSHSGGGRDHHHHYQQRSPLADSGGGRASTIHFAFERQPPGSASVHSRISGASPAFGGGASPHHYSPGYYSGGSGSRGHTHSVGGYGDFLDTGGAGSTLCGKRAPEYRPAVPVPLLSGSGPQGIPDFLTLTDEANERAGGLQSLKRGAVLSYDEVSTRLARPKGLALMEDVDGAEAWVARPSSSRGEEAAALDDGEEEGGIGEGDGEAVGPKARELMGLWTLGQGRSMMAVEEEEASAAGVIVESWAAAETDLETMPDYDEDVISIMDGAAVEGDGALPLEVAAAVGGRFHPLGQLEWERGIRWGLEGIEEDEGEEEEGEDEEEEDESAAPGPGLNGGAADDSAPAAAAKEEEEVEGEDEEEAEEGEMEDPRVLLERRRAEEARRRQRVRRLAATARATTAAAAAAAGGGGGSDGGDGGGGGVGGEGLVDPAARTAAWLEEEAERVLRAPFPLNPELGSLRWTQAIVWDDTAALSAPATTSTAALVLHPSQLQRRPPRPLPPTMGRLILDLNDPGIFLQTPPLPRLDLARMGLLPPGKAAATAAATRAAEAALASNADKFGLGRRAALQIPALEHAECALKHEATVGGDPSRVCLTPEELRHFHRPRLARPGDVRWALRAPKDKGDGVGGGGGGGGRARAASSMVTKTIRTTKDLGAHEGEIVLIEYVEERPLLLSNPGMAAKLINLWRLSKADLQAEQELARDKAREFGGGGKWGTEGPPRISRETLGAAAVLAGLDRAHAGVPDFPQGQTVVLDPEEPSPFLGQIEDRYRQAALFTNLFKAPLFEHQARATDFLLVKANAAKVRNPPPAGAAAAGGGAEAECYAVREIPRVYLCGQQEPLVVVPDPGEERFKKLLARLVRLALVVRLAASGGADVIPCVRMFDGLYDLLSDKADKEGRETKKNNQVTAQLRQVGQQVPGAMLDHRYTLNRAVSVEEALRDVTPEEMCMYESMCAGVRRLLDEGIDLVGKLEALAPPKVEAVLASNLQRLLQQRQERAERAWRSVDLLRGTPRAAEAEEVAAQMQALYEEVREVIAVGAFFLDEVQLAPWFLTHCYQFTHVEHKYANGRLKLSGLGDPSGRGEAFSFLPQRLQAEGRPFREVFPTLNPKLQEIIGDTPPHRMGVALMNDILKHVWSVPALRRAAEQRLSRAGYSTEFADVMRQTRLAKKERVHAILDIQSDTAPTTNAGVQQYLDVRNRIWNKQVNALSDESGLFGDEEAPDFDLDEDGGGVGGGGMRAQPRFGGGMRMGEGVGGGVGAGAAAGTQGLATGGGGFMEQAPQTEADAAAAARALAEQAREEEIRRQQVALMQGVALPAVQRPRQVVKRLIKEVDRDGTERYRVEFLLAPGEVERVLRERAQRVEELRKEMRRARKRAAAAAAGDGDGGSVAGFGGEEEGGGGNKLRMKDTRKRRKGDLTISLGALQAKAAAVKAEKAKEKLAKCEAEKAMYERTYAGVPGRRSGGEGGEGGRMAERPRNVLRDHLMVIYARMETMPFAKPFKRLKTKGMDMQRVHKKITKWQYESRREFVEDLAAIAADAAADGDATLTQYAQAVQAEGIRGVQALDEAELGRIEAELAATSARSLKKRRKQQKEAKKQQKAAAAAAAALAAASSLVGAVDGRGAGGGSLAPAPMLLGAGGEGPSLLGGPQPPMGLIGVEGGQPLIFPGDGGGGMGGGGGGGQPLILLPGGGGGGRYDAGEDSSSGEEEVLQIDQL